MRQTLAELDNPTALRYGLKVNDKYWKHFVDLRTGHLHVAVDLEVAVAFQVGDDLIITDKRTMEQVGRLPAPESGAVYIQCPGCGDFHPEP